MTVDDDLEMLLGEIPQATSSLNQHQQNHHLLNNASNCCIGLVDCNYGNASYAPLPNINVGCVQGNVNGCYGDNESTKHKYGFPFSPRSGFSLQSDGSSSSLLSSGGGSHSDNGSQSFSQFEEFKTQLSPGNGIWIDLKRDDERNLVEEFNLPRNFSKMCVSDVQVQQGALAYSNGIRYCDQSLNGAAQMSYGPSCDYRKDFSDGRGFPLSVPGEQQVKISREACSLLTGMRHDPAMAKYSPSRYDRLLRQPEFSKYAPGPNFSRTNMLANESVPTEYAGEDPRAASWDNTLVGGTLFHPSQKMMSLVDARDSFCSPNMVQLTQMMPCYDRDTPYNYQTTVLNGRNKVSSHLRVPQGRVESLIREGNVIIPGDGINYGIKKDTGPKVCNSNYPHERGVGKIKDKSLQLDGHLYNAIVQDSCQSPKMSFPFVLPSKCSSLGEARGYIHHIAKNQQGCRVLQKLFDEGTSMDVQIIFNEIIDHAVELMMNPFGNYLMQKLLEVCNEEQRMRILLKVTQEPGELVRICLNTHGTRVVQKLIETLKTRQQISLVISALEPGFLTLIKDLNGNHVIQRCLQCFTNEDSKFIFVAATKHCVEIATHQHGCCVLQRCISQSRAEHRDKLISEISENGFLLAQDAFGNYVVQFILELMLASSTEKLTSQFEGKYVHLSTQKFSSHVVERCLLLCNDEIRSKIIRELLSTTYFDQLLQDPHANYVVQTALRISEGSLYMSLVDAIESYRAVARNSPYSKRIFSNKLLKR